MQETQETSVQSLSWEDPLEKEMATHSSILGLENFMDSTAWWAAVHGVAKSRARLSDLIELNLLRNVLHFAILGVLLS